MGYNFIVLTFKQFQKALLAGLEGYGLHLVVQVSRFGRGLDILEFGSFEAFNKTVALLILSKTQVNALNHQGDGVLFIFGLLLDELVNDILLFLFPSLHKLEFISIGFTFCSLRVSYSSNTCSVGTS